MKMLKYLEPNHGEPVVGRIGAPIDLPSHVPYPLCRHCDSAMVAFLSIHLGQTQGVPFPPGSWLSIFMCPKHNEIPSFAFSQALTDDYWNRAEGHWFAYVATDVETNYSAPPEFLRPVQLGLVTAPANSRQYLLIGGEPQWLQEPEAHTCSCGTPMRFVAQLSESYRFEALPDAPAQPDSPFARDYVLFLGNEVYVFACPKICNPRAVWFSLQN